MSKKAMTATERFMRSVDTTPGQGPNGDCHEWRGYRDRDGYGKLPVNRRAHLAHRFASELAHGPIPEGIVVCHTCDNPPCCNDGHLFRGTVADNNRDMLTKGRNGTLVGEQNGNAKLTDAQVSEMRGLWASGTWRQCELATRYATPRSTICLIVKGHSRKSKAGAQTPATSQA